MYLVSATKLSLTRHYGDTYSQAYPLRIQVARPGYLYPATCIWCKRGFTDCSEALRSSTASDGVYIIRPGLSDNRRTARVYCQRDRVDGTGWTVIQRRTDGGLSFARGWDDYADGFGDAPADYWLGNEYVHRLTSGRPFRLRADMWDVQGRYWVAEYPAFRVASSDELYRLDLGRPPADEDTDIQGNNRLQLANTSSSPTNQ